MVGTPCQMWFAAYAKNNVRLKIRWQEKQERAYFFPTLVGNLDGDASKRCKVVDKAGEPPKG